MTIIYKCNTFLLSALSTLCLKKYRNVDSVVHSVQSFVVYISEPLLLHFVISKNCVSPLNLVSIVVATNTNTNTKILLTTFAYLLFDCTFDFRLLVFLLERLTFVHTTL